MKNINPKVLGILAVLLAVLMLTTVCGSEKPAIRLHAWESDSHFLNNAIFKFVVENGYGYPVETVVQNTPVLKETLPKGEVDLNLEGWHHNIVEWYDEHLAKGNIVNLGMNFEGGPQFYIIPGWVSKEYNIKTILDMKDHWELFKDPEDPSKGAFYSGILGWEVTHINRVKLKAYGLDGFYNEIVPGSPPALEGVLEDAQKRGRPVFGYYWAPTALMGTYDWYILEEPDYSEDCWDKVTAAVGDDSISPVPDACAFPNVPIDKIAHASLQQKAPDVVTMLNKMSVGLEPLNLTMAWAKENSIVDWEEAAVYYLRNYEDRWRSWVHSEAHQNIKEALEDMPR